MYWPIYEKQLETASTRSDIGEVLDRLIVTWVHVKRVTHYTYSLNVLWTHELGNSMYRVYYLYMRQCGVHLSKRLCLPEKINIIKS